MPLIRVYLPLAPGHLDALAAGEPLGPTPLAGHAVTTALGTPGLTTDEEELEHTAWLAAVDDAGAVMARAGAQGARRVVASVDIEPSGVSSPVQPDVASRVVVAEEVPLRRVVSFHVDEEPGASGAQDLLWYDVTELDEVRALLAQSLR
jgi:hypothetical protein